MRAILSVALGTLMIASGVLMIPDAAQAAGARIPSRGIPSFYRATLQHAAKTQGAVRAPNNDRWRCSGTRCDGMVVRQFGVPACQALVRVQGAVASFTGYDAGHRRSLRLNAAQLRQCNDSSQQGSLAVHAGRVPRVTVHVDRPVPDTVRTGQLILVGKPQAPDTVRTGTLALVGKPQAQAAPDTVPTGKIILVGKKR